MASRLKELSSVFPPHIGLFFIRHFQQTSFKWLFAILKSFLLFILKNYKKRWERKYSTARNLTRVQEKTVWTQKLAMPILASMLIWSPLWYNSSCVNMPWKMFCPWAVSPSAWPPRNSSLPWRKSFWQDTAVFARHTAKHFSFRPAVHETWRHFAKALFMPALAHLSTPTGPAASGRSAQQRLTWFALLLGHHKAHPTSLHWQQV